MIEQIPKAFESFKEVLQSLWSLTLEMLPAALCGLLACLLVEYFDKKN